MRIISGKHKGKKLLSFDGDDIRPTTDRVKESLFNVLKGRIDTDGISALDLFSGSGSLGLEAYSRGAKTVVFCDADPNSIKLTRKNMQSIGADLKVICTDYVKALSDLNGSVFDLIFLDPPYNKGYIEKAIKLIGQYNLLDDYGIIAIDHSVSEQFALPENFEVSFSRTYGKMAITLVSFK